jgi:protocatechuate 3,4-dioxygenase beta subunit
MMLFLGIFLVLYSIAYCEDKVCSLQFSPCVLTPEEIEGPYYVPYHLIRKDIREGKPGLQLNLRLIINDVNTCKPLPNVSVDIWHCDEFGYYSSYLKYDPNKPPLDGEHIEPTDNSTFMRGVQYTDENGIVDFVTNFPGI